MARYRVEVSAGEFFDRMAILELKHHRLADPDARARAGAALDVLRREVPAAPPAGLEELRGELSEVNGRLWDLEEELRDFERSADFGEPFVAAARSVYRLNDQRAVVKRRIDDLLGSAVVEDKSYV